MEQEFSEFSEYGESDESMKHNWSQFEDPISCVLLVLWWHPVSNTRSEKLKLLHDLCRGIVIPRSH